MRITLFEEARMRGDDRQQAAMFSYISAEARVPEDHPLRRSARWSMRSWPRCPRASPRCMRE
jgi:hypothetical protein